MRRISAGAGRGSLGARVSLSVMVILDAGVSVDAGVSLGTGLYFGSVVYLGAGISSFSVEVSLGARVSPGEVSNLNKCVKLVLYANTMLHTSNIIYAKFLFTWLIVCKTNYRYTSSYVGNWFRDKQLY